MISGLVALLTLLGFKLELALRFILLARFGLVFYCFSARVKYQPSLKYSLAGGIKFAEWWAAIICLCGQIGATPFITAFA